LGKIVCVGRNYAAHARELNNPVPERPLIFMKPATAAVDLTNEIKIPAGGCHFETELAVLIDRPLRKVSPEQAESGIHSIGLALDLTLRDLQSELKSKGHPWELAKAFDGACPITAFVPISELPQAQAITFALDINGQNVQTGKAEHMLTPIPQLLAYISEHFTLQPGDVVLTGTPEGVGQLHDGDQLQLSLQAQHHFNTTVRCHG